MTHCEQQIKWDEINIQEDVKICWHCNFYNVVEKLLSKRFRIESMILTEKRLWNLMKFIIYVCDILDFWKFLCAESIISFDNWGINFSMVYINISSYSINQKIILIDIVWWMKTVNYSCTRLLWRILMRNAINCNMCVLCEILAFIMSRQSKM